MRFSKRIPEWHEQGSEPSENLKRYGWGAGEKPAAQHFNWFQNGMYEATKELQENAVHVEKLTEVEDNFSQQLSEMSYNVKSFGARGDGVTDDTQSILKAIGSGRRKVLIPAGIYVISETLKLPRDTDFELNPNAVLKPSSNINVIELQRNTAISGGTINTENVEGYDKACVYIDGKSRIATNDQKTSINNLLIQNARGGNGKGIYFYAEGNDVADQYISGVYSSNVNITGGEYGIYMKSSTANTHMKWINSNIFNNVTIDYCKKCIVLEGLAVNPSQVNGNFFTNIFVQTRENITEIALSLNTATNSFVNFRLWDTFRSSVKKLVVLLGNQNYFLGDVLPDNINTNNYNKIENTRYGQQAPSKYYGVMGAREYPSEHGNQDDFLTFADKRYNVSLSTPASSGGVGNLFNLNSNNILRWDGDEVYTITIDFNTSISWIKQVGIIFNTVYTAGYIKVEYKNENDVWVTLNEDSNQNSLYYVAYFGNSVSGAVKGLRFTVGQKNASSIRIERIFGFSGGVHGQTWLPKNGGSMYGEVINEMAGQGFVVTTPDGTKKYRIGVDNSGAITTTLIP